MKSPLILRLLSIRLHERSGMICMNPIRPIAKSSQKISPLHFLTLKECDVVRQLGTEHRDEMRASGFMSNHAGGILGGISSGQDVLARIALKPTSSLTTPGKSVTISGEEVDVITKGRHDPCVGIRAVPIAEAMLALVLCDHLLRMRGQTGRI